MQELQMNKFKDTTKKINARGITLTSLVIYMTIMFVILALIMRVTTYYTNNIKDVADITFETEFEKFNMYMLQETKKSDNRVIGIANNSITFSDGNTLSFQDENLDGEGEIYFNDIKICEFVNECSFTVINDNQTSKTSVVVDITIHETEKQVSYVLQNISDDVEASKEEDYTIKTKIPKSYQEVEYVESTGAQWIDTGYKNTTNNIEIETTISLSEEISGEVDYIGNQDVSTGRFVCGYADNVFFAYNRYQWETYYNVSIPAVNDEDVKYNINVKYEYDNNIKALTVNDVTESETFNQSIISSQSIKLFKGGDNNYYFKGKMYSMKIYDNNILVRDFIPCWRISDGEIGMFDTVTEQFYTNEGTGTFLKGPDVD